MIKVGDTLQGAADDLKRNGKVMVGASAITLAITSIVGAIGAGAVIGGGGTTTLVLALLAYAAITMFLSMGMIGLSLEVVRGRRPKLKELFGQASTLPRAMVSVISHLIVGVGATAPLAFIPAVGPALHFVAAMGILSLTCLAPFYVVDKKQGPLRALWSAFKETEGNRLPVMGVLFASTLLMGASSIIPVLGPLLATPFMSLALARAYEGTRGEPVKDPLRTLPPAAIAELRLEPLRAVTDSQVEDTLSRFEDELRGDGKLPV